MSNKKAQMDTAFNWALYRITIVTIVGIFFIVVLRSYYSSGLNSYDVENIVLMKRLMYSENLLAYQDSITGRVYPGIIDLKKFDTKYLEETLLNKNSRLAVNLELTNLETEEIKRAYVNEERARVWDDWVVMEGFESNNIRRYVKIYDKGEFFDGVLKIKVLIKK